MEQRVHHQVGDDLRQGAGLHGHSKFGRDLGDDPDWPFLQIGPQTGEDLLQILGQVQLADLLAGLIDRHLLEATDQLGGAEQVGLQDPGGLAGDAQEVLEIAATHAALAVSDLEGLGGLAQMAGRGHTDADRGVHLMRDASHQVAKCSHPLGLQQRVLCRCKGGLGLPARSDVAADPDVERLAVDLAGVQRQLERKQAAVAPLGQDLAFLAHDPWITGFLELLHMLLVHSRRVTRHEAGDRGADHLLHAPTEDALGRRVEFVHHSGAVDRDHRIGGGVQNGAELALTHGQLPLGGPPLLDLGPQLRGPLLHPRFQLLVQLAQAILGGLRGICDAVEGLADHADLVTAAQSCAAGHGAGQILVGGVDDLRDPARNREVQGEAEQQDGAGDPQRALQGGLTDVGLHRLQALAVVEDDHQDALRGVQMLGVPLGQNDRKDPECTGRLALGQDLPAVALTDPGDIAWADQVELTQ